MRSLYRGRRSALLESLKTELGVAINVAGEQAGMHLSITLPKGYHDEEIAERASRQRLWLAPLSIYYLQNPVQQGFVLGFSSVPAEGMSRAVRRLKSVLHPA
jgi:GntR family transcriptional regulator/MocR family aminotransferase